MFGCELRTQAVVVSWHVWMEQMSVRYSIVAVVGGEVGIVLDGGAYYNRSPYSFSLSLEF